MSTACTICKQSTEPSAKAQIYFPNGHSQVLNLCPGHDLELYKLGQINFCNKYKMTIVKNGSRGDPQTKFSLKDIA